jgi:outer membrane biosynthesis protein TonB
MPNVPAAGQGSLSWIPNPKPLAPVGKMTAGPLLLPKQGSWSTNKILVIVGVALALVLVTVLTVLLVSRSKPKPAATPAVAEDTTTPPKRAPVEPPAEAAETAAPKPKDSKGKKVAAEKAKPKQIAVAKKQEVAKKPKHAAVAKVSKHEKRKQSARKPTPQKRRPRKPTKPKVSAEDLLSAGAKRAKKKSSKRQRSDPSADDLLALGAQGSRKSRKSKRRIREDNSGAPTMSRGVDADALLSAGAGRKSKNDLPQTLSKRQIKGVMRRLKSRVAACYEKYKIRGTLSIRMSVRGSGKATGRVVGKFANTPTGGCVAQKIGGLRFPRFSGPTMDFTYPFTLGK